MSTPQQQIIDKCKLVFAQATALYGVDMSHVGVHFDLKGRAAGTATQHGKRHYIRFNHDMLTRDAFDHMLNDTVPHEIAHILCFMDPRLGSGHNNGWRRVCITLGGKPDRCHTEEVVYGKGTTYEYVTSTGKMQRVGDKYHNDIQCGRPLKYRGDIGTITRSCTYTIVGRNGVTLKTPIVKTGVAPVAVTPTRVTVAPVLRTPTFFIGAPVVPAAPVKTFAAGNSKASIARAIMLAGHTRGETYENVIAAIMQATGHNRQLARATYKANESKVGCAA